MKMFMRKSSCAALGLAMAMGGLATAADPPRANSVNPAPVNTQPAITTTTSTTTTTDANNAHHARMTMCASELMKLSVKNSAGDKIGSIDDLVMDVHTGKIAYAALGFGGVLGFGEKLFAVPWSQFHLQKESNSNEHFLVLDVSTESLKTAPGFNKDHWPDFADANFTRQIDEHYKAPSTR